MERKIVTTLVEKSHYFTKVDKDCHDFIHSGSTLLDCVLGGGFPLGRMSNIVGDASSGKCVKNGYILSNEGMKDISKFSNGNLGATELQIQLATSHFSIRDTSHFYEEKVTNLIKVTTKAGFTIEATPNHPILVWTRDCKATMRRLYDLREGDIAIIAGETCFFGKHIINLSNYCHIEETQKPILLTGEVANLFGYIVGHDVFMKDCEKSDLSSYEKMKKHIDTVLTIYGVSFLGKSIATNNIPTNKANIKECVFELSDEFYNTVFKAFNSPKNLDGMNRFVPSCILESPAKIQRAFIRGLIESLCFFGKKGLQIYTVSEQLATQLQLMFLNFGIFTTKKNKSSSFKLIKDDSTYWTIQIERKFLGMFNRVIGLNSPEPSLQFIIGNEHDNKIPYLYKKLINFIEDNKKLLKDDSKKLKDFDTQLEWFFKQQKSVTYETLNRIMDIFYKFNLDIEFLKDLGMSGFYFDKITSLEHKTYPEKISVYDVCVPTYHTFWCNGFISHNTLLAIETCANFHDKFPDGKIVYLEAEAAFDESYAEALGMPIQQVDFVGDQLVDYTVESWFDHMDSTIKELTKSEQPCLYIVDSLDALSDRAEKGREIDKGSYGANKPKMIGQLFRRLTKEIERTKIHLMIISQVRDNIGVLFGEKHTRTGGKAMDFYASQILWLAQMKKLDKTIRKQKRVYGVQVKAKCKKNKIGLPFRECEFPIIFGYGVDNIYSMIAWLESIDEEAAIEQLVKDLTYKTFADLTETIKALPKPDRKAIIETLSDYCITAWQDIENRFIPKNTKY